MEQVRRTEKLHDQIDPTQNYPFDFLSYRITGYRSEAVPPTVLTGQAILPDLRLMIDRLSHSVPIPVTEDDPVETPAQLAARLNVSIKTISRWRTMGLRWRWVVQPGQKHKTIAIPAAAAQRFLNQHRDRVQQAAQRQRITQPTQQAILCRARRLAQATGASLNRVAAHLAKRLHRAHPTIRQLLQRHDQQHPQDKIFAHDTKPLSNQQKRTIARAYRSGVPISQIARRFKRTRATVYRAVRHRRAAALRRLRISYVHSPLFDRDNADTMILAPSMAPDPIQPALGSTTPVSDLPQPLHPLYDHPAPNPVQQRHHLTRFNYLKFKAATIRDQLNRYDPRAADLDQIERLIKQAAATRDTIAQQSLPLVLSVARRHLIDQPDRSTAHLVLLLEIATPVLIDAINQYDITRPQTFSAYLTWRLMQRFAGHLAAVATGPTRAHRKLEGPTALARIRNAAAARGVRIMTQSPSQHTHR